jgi:hypothetical protein
MAVTDLTDSLPYWARQGGPGAAGGPTGAPQGAGDSQAWLQYLSQMYGITPDQAATMMQGGGSPMEMNPHGDGPSPPVSPKQMYNFGNPPPINGPGPGNVGPAALAPNVTPPRPIAAAQPAPPPAASAGPPIGAGMLDQSGVARMGGPNGVLNTQPPTGASAPVGAGLLDQSGVTRNPAGVLTPGTAPTAPVAAPAPVPGPLAGGGAAGTGATSNPRFIGIDAPNFSPQNSMRAGPQGTALNLAGLFGGGGQNPNIPASNAQPVSGVLAPGGMSNAPWSMGPLQKGMVWPNDMGPMTPDQIAGRGLKRRYG